MHACDICEPSNACVVYIEGHMTLCGKNWACHGDCCHTDSVWLHTFRVLGFYLWFLAPKDVSYFPKSLAIQLKECCILSSSTVCFVTGVFKLFPMNVNLMLAWAETKPCYGWTVNMFPEDTRADWLAASPWALERLLTPEFSDFMGGFINGLSHGQCTIGRWGPARGLGSL